MNETYAKQRLHADKPAQTTVQVKARLPKRPLESVVGSEDDEGKDAEGVPPAPDAEEAPTQAAAPELES